jgi:hypothetical protein
MRRVYLDKRGSEDDPAAWVYYTVLGDDEEDYPLVLQLVAFPDFRQRDVIVATLGGTTRERMLPKMMEIAKTQWGIDPDRSVLIGVIKIEPGEVAY